MKERQRGRPREDEQLKYEVASYSGGKEGDGGIASFIWTVGPPGGDGEEAAGHRSLEIRERGSWRHKCGRVCIVGKA